MLTKDPKNRITIDEIKFDPFFGGIDWDRVLNKEYKPPINCNDEDDDRDDNVRNFSLRMSL
jgi:hypothetical protein